MIQDYSRRLSARALQDALNKLPPVYSHYNHLDRLRVPYLERLPIEYYKEPATSDVLPIRELEFELDLRNRCWYLINVI